MRRTVRVVTFAVLMLGAMAVTRFLRVAAFHGHQDSKRYEDVYYLPNAAYLPVMSLGYRQAFASFLWCRSLVYFGEQLGQRGPVAHAFDYTDAILALDPSFRAAYRWIALAALYRPVAVDVQLGLRASRYLERAIARWPSDGELHWDYGSLLRFDLAPLVTDTKEKERLLELAAPHLAMAAELGAGPPWLAVVSADLLNKLGRTEQAIRHLEEVYGTVQDEAVRQSITERLSVLYAQRQSAGIRAASERFEDSWQRSYPYLSAGLFFLIGPRSDADAYGGSVAERFLPNRAVMLGALDEEEESDESW